MPNVHVDIRQCVRRSEKALPVIVIRQSNPSEIGTFSSPMFTNTVCCWFHSVPSDFHEVLKTYTQRGFRVIALAWRPLDRKLTWHQAQRIKRYAANLNVR